MGQHTTYLVWTGVVRAQHLVHSAVASTTGTATYNSMESASQVWYRDAGRDVGRDVRARTTFSALALSTMTSHQSNLSGEREDAAAQFDSLCSSASTVSSLSMPASGGWSASTITAMAVGPTFSWEYRQGVEEGRNHHTDRLDGKHSSLRSRAGQPRSHPYHREKRASSPPPVEGSNDMTSIHHPLSTMSVLHDDSELSMGPGNPHAFRFLKSE